MFEHDPEKSMRCFAWALHGLGAFVAAVVVPTVWWMTSAPLEFAHRDHAARTSELAELLERSNEVKAEHARLTAALQQFKADAVAIQQRIPAESLEAEFLAQLTETAQTEGVHILDYRPGVATARDEYSQMEIGLSCQGTYASLCRFVSRLEEMPRLAHLVALQIEGQPPASIYPAEMSLVIYFGGKASVKTAAAKEAVGVKR